MSGIILSKIAQSQVPLPAPGKEIYFVDLSDGKFKKRLDSGSFVDLESGLTYSDPQAKDAAGAALVDTASLDLSYNGTLKEISGVVLPAGVNHDALANFVAAKHVDHTSVNIATAAGSGLSGGGNISATRNLAVSINTLPEKERPSIFDEVLIWDVAAGALKKSTLSRANRMNPDYRISLSSDFVVEASGGLAATVSGTGASGQAGTYGIDTTENASGVWQIDTGTTAVGRATLGGVAYNMLIFNAGEYYRIRTRIALEALSDGTQTFFAYTGFINISGAGDHTNGAYFRYTDGVNGGRWEAVVATAGVRSVIDTGVMADTLYSVFEVQMDSQNITPTCRFYINGTLVATMLFGTHNVPTGTANSFGIGWKIEKTVGITQRNLSADWFSFEYERLVAR